jgi:hypothetical protein
MYLRDLTLYQYKAGGEFVLSLYVPYAKMFAQSVSDCPSWMAEFVGTGKKTDCVPYIMLESVHRNFESAVIAPEFTYADSEPHDTVTYMMIPMLYDDFLLVAETSTGAATMPLISLYQFVSRAEKYGFSAEIYGQMFIRRICYPLVLLILSIIVGMLGWNYRLAKTQVFKFVWVFILPVFTIVAYLLVEAFVYCLNLLHFLLVGYLSFYAFPVSIALYTGLLILVSILFLALRGE